MSMISVIIFVSILILILIGVMASSLSTVSDVYETTKSLREESEEQEGVETTPSIPLETKDMQGGSIELLPTPSGTAEILKIEAEANKPEPSNIDISLVLIVIFSVVAIVSLIQFLRSVNIIKSLSKFVSYISTSLKTMKVKKFLKNNPSLERLMNLQINLANSNITTVPRTSELLNTIKTLVLSKNFEVSKNLVDLDFYDECNLLIEVAKHPSPLPNKIKYLKEVESSLEERSKGLNSECSLEQELRLFRSIRNLRDDANKPLSNIIDLNKP